MPSTYPKERSSQNGREHWLVFADDWGRHPSSCQYLIQNLLEQIDVTWVNTIGMRPPRFDRVTFNRILGKIRSRSSQQPQSHWPESQPYLQPRVVSPWMWPWYKRSWDRALNRFLLGFQLRNVLARGTHPHMAITTIPIVADLMDRLPVNRWVYYCVDDFSLWPGLDQESMGRMELDVVARADRLIAASMALQERIGSMGRSAALCTHGVDMELWQPSSSSRYLWPTSIPGPIALFWGVIDRRLDAELITYLCRNMPQLSVVFVGPMQHPDPALGQLSNVHFLPAVNTRDLAAMAQAADCLIMPYAKNPLTFAMQPLKLKEYLASGRPTVVRRLPSTEPWSNACDVADTAENFYLAVKRCLEEGISIEQRIARRSLESESWQQKASAFHKLVKHDL